MIEKLISLLISIVPLIVYQSRFEAPKVYVFLCLGITIIIYFIFSVKKLVIKKRDIWYLSWVLVLYISNFNLFGASYRNQSAVFFICLLIVFKFVESLSSSSRSFLYKLAGVSVLTQSLLVIMGYKLGTLGDINAVSGFIAIGLPFLLEYLPKRTVFIPLMAMVLDFSKAGFLALTPYIFKKIKISYILIIVLISVIFIIKPINLSSPFENRLVIWKHSINLIKEKPILGYGSESNEVLFDEAFYKSGFPLSNLIIDRAHNLFLDITLWSGIVGLFLFCGFLIETYKNLSLFSRKIFLIFLTFSFFQPLSVSHWILFALLV